MVLILRNSLWMDTHPNVFKRSLTLPKGAPARCNFQIGTWFRCHIHHSRRAWRLATSTYLPLSKKELIMWVSQTKISYSKSSTQFWGRFLENNWKGSLRLVENAFRMSIKAAEATLTNKHFSNTMHWLGCSTKSSCMYFCARMIPA
jgi:hypothetical protein